SSSPALQHQHLHQQVCTPPAGTTPAPSLADTAQWEVYQGVTTVLAGLLLPPGRRVAASANGSTASKGGSPDGATTVLGAAARVDARQHRRARRTPPPWQRAPNSS
ncbi:unnamed protein product, partial [Ectocarpus sp. 13 AM-2016]